MRYDAPVAEKTIIAGITPRAHKRRGRHLVAVVVFDGVVLTDFAIPCDVFRLAQVKDGESVYDLRVCGVRPTSASSCVSLIAGAPLTLLRRADTIVVPGITDPDVPVP